MIVLLAAWALAGEPTHPGEVVFVDLTAKTESRRPVAEVPETIAWATVEGRRVAVVRVESSVMAGGAREIKRFGADGVLIDVTVSAPPPRR